MRSVTASERMNHCFRARIWVDVEDRAVVPGIAAVDRRAVQQPVRLVQRQAGTGKLPSRAAANPLEGVQHGVIAAVQITLKTVPRLGPPPLAVVP